MNKKKRNYKSILLNLCCMSAIHVTMSEIVLQFEDRYETTSSCLRMTVSGKFIIYKVYSAGPKQAHKSF